MPETLLNKTPVLDGAGTVYQLKEGGPWYLYLWVKSERQRFRQSLETTDRPLAIRTAEHAELLKGGSACQGYVTPTAVINRQTTAQPAVSLL